ncbi:MAG: gluconokinase [Armatimonadetes bacterium]|nr:gluconokinase [Armatimonadota bacterium]
MKKATLLALDLGTSSVRAMLFDAKGRALPDMEAQIPYAQRTTADGGVEADAEMLLARTVECVKQLLGGADKDAKANLAGVGISCFWHSLVGVGDDGRAVTPVLSWADTRSQAQAERLRQELDPAAYHARTGCELHPSFWPAKLRWLHETRPDDFGKVRRWMSFGEYLALRLFGQASCSLSMASGTGLLNANAADWDPETLNVLPIKTDQLNSLVDRADAQRGLTKEFRRTLGPLADLPWFPALGDGACSNAGSGATDRTRIAINVGTSAAMRVMVRADRVDIRPGLFCYRADKERFLIGGAFANGGNVFAWMNATLQLGDRKAELRRLGTMAPDSHGLTVLPFWAGERSPGWHVHARAAVTGMNLHTTPLDILRASLEAVAYRFAAVRDLILQLPQDWGRGGPEIIVSGGALVHDPAWTQIIADVFGVPVITSRIAEASSRGAALFAAQSLGLIAELSDPPLYKGRSFQPNLAHHEIYQKARARHEELYGKILG